MALKKEHTLASGRKLLINTPSLELASLLRRTVATELRKVNLDLSNQILFLMISGPRPSIDKEDEVKAKQEHMGRLLSALAGTEVNVVWNTILTLLASKEIEDLLFACLATCQMNIKGPFEKVLPETFADEGAREDMIPAMLEVMKVALLPFFKGLGFGSSPLVKANSSDPK